MCIDFVKYLIKYIRKHKCKQNALKNELEVDKKIRNEFFFDVRLFQGEK